MSYQKRHSRVKKQAFIIWGAMVVNLILSIVGFFTNSAYISVPSFIVQIFLIVLFFMYNSKIKIYYRGTKYYKILRTNGILGIILYTLQFLLIIILTFLAIFSIASGPKNANASFFQASLPVIIAYGILYFILFIAVFSFLSLSIYKYFDESSKIEETNKQENNSGTFFNHLQSSNQNFNRNELNQNFNQKIED